MFNFGKGNECDECFCMMFVLNKFQVFNTFNLQKQIINDKIDLKVEIINI